MDYQRRESTNPVECTCIYINIDHLGYTDKPDDMVNEGLAYGRTQYSPLPRVRTS